MRLFPTMFVCVGSLVAAGEYSNRRAPSFTLPDLDLNYHDIFDYRGKIILLDFIQTACPVCASSSRIFETIRQKFPDKVQLISVAIPPDTQATVRQFVGQNSVKTPVLFDLGQVMAAYLRLKPNAPQVAFPHLFIIDAKGWIRNDYLYGHGTEKYFESLDPILKEVTALVKEISAPAPAGPKPPAAKK